MTAQLPNRVALRREQTGDVSKDRAQALAMRVATAHEQTKDVVSALANRTLVSLSTDNTLAGSAGVYTDLLTTTLTSVLHDGHLDILFTASGTHPTTANATTYFRVLVDGVFASGCYFTNGIANAAWAQSILTRVAVSKGPHTVLVQWSTDNNSARINAATSVNEHASLLVQEAL